jgi:hypothetical protein
MYPPTGTAATAATTTVDTCMQFKEQATCPSTCQWKENKPSQPPTTPPADSFYCSPIAAASQPYCGPIKDKTACYIDGPNGEKCEWRSTVQPVHPVTPPTVEGFCELKNPPTGTDVTSTTANPCAPMDTIALCGTLDVCKWTVTAPVTQPTGWCKSKLPATAAVSTTTDDKCYTYMTPASCHTASTCEWEVNAAPTPVTPVTPPIVGGFCKWNVPAGVVPSQDIDPCHMKTGATTCLPSGTCSWEAHTAPAHRPLFSAPYCHPTEADIKADV